VLIDASFSRVDAHEMSAAKEISDSSSWLHDFPLPVSAFGEFAYAESAGDSDDDCHLLDVDRE
jgi:hypothetical protein